MNSLLSYLFLMWPSMRSHAEQSPVATSLSPYSRLQLEYQRLKKALGQWKADWLQDSCGERFVARVVEDSANSLSTLALRLKKLWVDVQVEANEARNVTPMPFASQLPLNNLFFYLIFLIRFYCLRNLFVLGRLLFSGT